MEPCFKVSGVSSVGQEAISWKVTAQGPDGALYQGKGGLEAGEEAIFLEGGHTGHRRSPTSR